MRACQPPPANMNQLQHALVQEWQRIPEQKNQCEGSARLALEYKDDIQAAETFEFFLRLRKYRTCPKVSCKWAKLNHT